MTDGSLRQYAFLAITTRGFAIVALGVASVLASDATAVLAVLSVVGLLALGLAIGNLAARQTDLIPLIYIHATVPGLLCAWQLYGRELSLRRRRRVIAQPA